MTKAEKRVAVARDVLAQIKAKKYIATTGRYINVDLDAPLNGGEDLQTLLKDGTIKQCKVCALGSAFISYARLYDGVKIGGSGSADDNIGIGRYEGGEKHLHGGRGAAVLEKIFTEDQLNEIEEAFEYSQGVPVRLSEAEDEARLVYIMRNIVRNKGTFKPSAR